MKTRQVAGFLLFLVFAAVLIGAAWNHVVESRTPLASPGTSYLVDGHRMHLVCSGEGTPTVIAESGASEDSRAWTLLAGKLSRQFHFCAYDRAGFGASETQPGPRDAAHIADQLHRLLTAAGIHGPVLLLGHSLGGPLIRVYQARYPDDVAGLVFLDAGAPAAYDGTLGRPLGLTPTGFRTHAVADLVRWAAVASGYARLRGQCSVSGNCRPAPLLEDAREFFNMQRDMGEVPRHPVELPILILSEDGSPTVQTPEAREAWNRIQASLLTVSPRSERVVAIGGDHQLQLHCAGLVADQITAFAAILQKGSTPGFTGQTVTAPCGS